MKFQQLKEFTLFIFSNITVVPDYLISEKSFNYAVELCHDIDLKDVVYLALSIEFDFILITRDKKLFDGLEKKGYTKIMMFDDFYKQISLNESIKK